MTFKQLFAYLDFYLNLYLYLYQYRHLNPHQYLVSLCKYLLDEMNYLEFWRSIDLIGQSRRVLVLYRAGTLLTLKHKLSIDKPCCARFAIRSLKAKPTNNSSASLNQRRTNGDN